MSIGLSIYVDTSCIIYVKCRIIRDCRTVLHLHACHQILPHQPEYDHFNFLWSHAQSVVENMKTFFSMSHTSFPRCYVYLLEPHYSCAQIGSADYLLQVLLHIADMDSHYPQGIYLECHHVQTVHIGDYWTFWHRKRCVANGRQSLKFLTLPRKPLEHLWRSILFYSQIAPLGRNILCVCSHSTHNLCKCTNFWEI